MEGGCQGFSGFPRQFRIPVIQAIQNQRSSAIIYPFLCFLQPMKTLHTLGPFQFDIRATLPSKHCLASFFCILRNSREVLPCPQDHRRFLEESACLQAALRKVQVSRHFLLEATHRSQAPNPSAHRNHPGSSEAIVYRVSDRTLSNSLGVWIC